MPKEKTSGDRTGWKSCPCRIAPEDNQLLDMASAIFRKSKEDILRDALRQYFARHPEVRQALAAAC